MVIIHTHLIVSGVVTQENPSSPRQTITHVVGQRVLAACALFGRVDSRSAAAAAGRFRLPSVHERLNQHTCLHSQLASQGQDGTNFQEQLFAPRVAMALYVEVWKRS